MMSWLFSPVFYRRTFIMTLFSLLFLVFLGGLVRVTGSGMGCPDWPKCFGLLVPPTSESQLPENYKEIFAKPGITVADFNVVHTWTEYINRLFGALTGLFMLLMFASSWQYVSSNSSVTFFAAAAFVLVLIQGWIGAKVVATHLAGSMVSLHLMLAFGVLALVILSGFFSVKNESTYEEASLLNKILSPVLLILITVQILLGSRVRESIDLQNITEIIPQAKMLGKSYLMHKVFAAAIAGIAVLFWWINRNTRQYKKLTILLMVFSGIQILMGSLNAVYNLPGFSQVMHIALSPILFGLSMSLVLLSFFNSRTAQAYGGRTNNAMNNA